ncbi:MAG: tRNA (adenosine(37)-N6)-dimethylallyltransferase MiaA [Patescibacteria group bacterium]|jgi:tRNA dimethylallyltransferase|nr:tRNA (adenosine(37)-N6)-dimethylallyltransferase MiaA [Patescibacteria group bacterium]
MEILSNNKVIVILGPTSGGKTSLAVELAHRFDGEIVSADSRQVYRGMDIGTGKDLSEFSFKEKNGDNVNIPYHLMDVVDPRDEFDVVQWNKMAKLAIDDILKRNKLPIVVGGTGLYLQSLVDNYDFSETKPDKEERSLLEKKSIKDLIFILKNIKPGIEDELDENDLGNKRRLIRYIQILKNNKDFSIKKSLNSKNKYNFLLLGLTFPREVLNERIYKRLIQRIEKEGMIDEVKKLHENGVSWERMESFGLEYKHLSWYLNDKIFYVEMVEKLNIAIRQFAKRQMSWFRRWEKQGREIKWVDNTGEANNEIVNKFLSK